MERGPRYEVYAQLRESNLQSKRLKLDEFDEVSETPTFENSSFVKKSDVLGENDRVSAIPKPGFMRKSVNFHGMLSEFEDNVSVCEIPKSEYSPILEKSAKFHRKSNTFDENEQVSEVPRSNSVRKSVKFPEKIVEFSPTMKKKEGKKQGYSALAQSVPDFSSVLRKENRKPIPEYGNVSRIPTPPLSVSKRKSVMNSGEKQRMMMPRKSYASVEELKGLSIVAANGENNNNKRGRKSAIFSSKYY